MNDLTLAWHFVSDTLRDGSPIPPDGQWLRFEGKPVICRKGLHASIRLIDALQFAPGNTVCRVACANLAETHSDKFVCSSRLILWRLDGKDVLRAFARQAALSVIHLWDAPDIARRYLETGDESIRDAAKAAAWDAAKDAAKAAAWDAARDAAMAAARDAALTKFNTDLESLVLTARGNPDDADLLRLAGKRL